jgi:hypothetical protein
VKAFLEHFAAIIGSVTVSVLALSMSHEYGYFWTIGSQYQALLTTADYFANGVLWLPVAVFGIFYWIDWNRLKEEPPAPRDWKKKGTWISCNFARLFFGIWARNVYVAD